TGHRHDVAVAQLLQGASGERAAHPAGAVDDDRRRLVEQPALDLRLQVAAGDVHRAGDGPLLVLVRLADVEDQRAPIDLGGSTGGVDLGDLGLGGGEEVAEGGHG